MLTAIALTLYFLVPSSVEASTQVREVDCVHFWKDHAGNLVLSGKKVGQDVGPSPFGSEGGVYRCKLLVNEYDITGNSYLYIGEVGDASYIYLTRKDGIGVNSNRIISHGLSPKNLLHRKYSRFIPFIVDLEGWIFEPGSYEFELHYEHSFPQMVGLRSGVPTLESFKGIFYRILKDFPAQVFHGLQLSFFIFFFVIFITWPNITFFRKLLLCSFVTTSFISILFLASVPMYFLSPKQAQITFDLSQYFSLFFATASVCSFVSWDRKKKRNFFLTSSIAIPLGSIAVITLPARHQIGVLTFALVVVIVNCIPFVKIGFELVRRKIFLRRVNRRIRFAGPILVGLGIMNTWDLTTFLFFDSKFIFLNHFIFYPATIFQIWRWLMLEKIDQVLFQDSLNSFMKSKLKLISDFEKHGDKALNTIAMDLSEIVKARRISISEVIDRRTKLISFFGDYDKPDRFSEIVVNSPTDRLLKLDTDFLVASAADRPKDYFLIKLNQIDAVRAVLSVTVFEEDRIHPFVRHNFPLIQQACEILVNTFITVRDNGAKARLFELIRQKTHPLQVESEDYFLNYFGLANESSYVFILGDLAGSTTLNELYGADRIKVILDDFLELVFDQFKENGVIVNRDYGDRVTILIPRLDSDVDLKDTWDRGMNILRYLNDSSLVLSQLGKKYGVPAIIQFRFVMSSVQTEQGTKQAYRSFMYLVDASLDGASRVLSEIAFPDECLLFGPLTVNLEKAGELVKLPPDRLRGKTKNIQIFMMKKKLNND